MRIFEYNSTDRIEVLIFEWIPDTADIQLSSRAATCQCDLSSHGPFVTYSIVTPTFFHCQCCAKLPAPVRVLQTCMGSGFSQIQCIRLPTRLQHEFILPKLT